MHLSDLLFPRKCIFCHTLLPYGAPDALCTRCAPTLSEYQHPKPFSVFGVQQSDAVFVYRDCIRSAIHAYKFRHAKYLSVWFSAQLKMVLQTHIEDWKPDLISYVPMGFGRYYTRGYNQSALLAKSLAKAFSIPCVSLLRKRPFVKHQVGLSGAARWKNAADAFSPRKHIPIAGKRILLIDDVITSGATLSACAALLPEASSIFVLAIAKTPENMANV